MLTPAASDAKRLHGLLRFEATWHHSSIQSSKIRTKSFMLGAGKDGGSMPLQHELLRFPWTLMPQLQEIRQRDVKGVLCTSKPTITASHWTEKKLWDRWSSTKWSSSTAWSSKDLLKSSERIIPVIKRMGSYLSRLFISVYWFFLAVEGNIHSQNALVFKVDHCIL